MAISNDNTKTLLLACRTLSECIAATGKALAHVVRAINEEFPSIEPRMTPIMEELIRDLTAAALLLPDETKPGPA